MLSLSLRAVRPQVARMAARQCAARRTLFATPARKDLVQDMYLREIKAFKPAAVKASDSEGQVLKFNVPSAPASPEEANLSEQLAGYETQTVEVEGQASTEGDVVASREDDWFEEEPEEGEGAH